MSNLTKRDINVLIEAEYFVRKPEGASRWCYRGFGPGWFNTGDVGGSSNSHHSRTLRKLADRGLLESAKRDGGTSRERGRNAWKLTESGLAIAREHIERLKQSWAEKKPDAAAASRCMDIRKRSKRGFPVDDGEIEFCAGLLKKFPDWYRNTEREVFNATVPFGSTAQV